MLVSRCDAIVEPPSPRVNEAPAILIARRLELRGRGRYRNRGRNLHGFFDTDTDFDADGSGFGILPATLAEGDPIDPYATDAAYWRSFWPTASQITAGP
jgi:hypothetical protein